MKYNKSSKSSVNFALLISATMILMISGCSGDGGSSKGLSSLEGKNPPEFNLTWSVCETDSNLECSSMEVPADYKEQDGKSITIALNRLPATGSEKLGNLVLNPGGPGGSGIEALQQISVEQTIPEQIRKSYDIVGFDPRGVGDSTPVDCTEFESEIFNDYPKDTNDVNQILTRNSAAASQCFEKYGDYLTQLGSINVVRDMESMRKALGDEKLNFIGFSYGTRLAALYLQEYPIQSGRMVLDASMLPDPAVLALSEGALEPMQTNLRRMLSYCQLSNSDCNPANLESALTARVNMLLASDNPATEQELQLLIELIIQGTQEPGLGEVAAGPITEYLLSEEPSILVDFIGFLEAMTGSDTAEDSDIATAELAVMCADDATRPSSESLIPLLARLNSSHDLFAEMMVAQTSMCAGWPAAVEPLTAIAVDTAPISLVIGGTTDAITPVHWGRMMAQSIGAVFVESHHLGHTVLFQDSNSCADNIATRFLVEGILPENAICLLEEEE